MIEITQNSIDFGDTAAQQHEENNISKEKFSADISMIESPQKAQTGANRSKHENEMTIKEMSRFGGSLASASIYSNPGQPASKSG